MFILSCTRDHQPSIPAEEERHHITETEYDEEFWQKLQTDSLFIELREIVDYRNHSLKKGHILKECGDDAEAFEAQLNKLIDDQINTVRALSDSLKSRYPDKYDVCYWHKMVENMQASTRYSIIEAVIIGDNIDGLMYYLHAILEEGMMVCEGLATRGWDPQWNGAEMLRSGMGIAMCGGSNHFYNFVMHPETWPLVYQTLHYNIGNIHMWGYPNIDFYDPYGLRNHILDRGWYTRELAEAAYYCRMFLGGYTQYYHNASIFQWGSYFEGDCGCNYLGEGQNPVGDPSIPPPNKSYTITLDVKPAGSGSVSGGGRYEYGTPITISATPKSGYKFSKWTGNMTSSSPSMEMVVLGNMNLTANFIPAPKVTLEMDMGKDSQGKKRPTNEVQLTNEYSINIKVVPENTAVQSVTIYYSRDSTGNPMYMHSIYTGTSTTYKRKAIKPGYWYARAVVQTQNGSYTTPYKEVCETYPISDTILSKATVKTRFDELWGATKSFATANAATHEVQEEGAWVWLDTAGNGVYSVETGEGVEKHTVALVAGVNEAYVTMSQPADEWNDTGDPTTPGKFVVGHFHTHFPICYAQVESPGIQRNPCGPTIGADDIIVNNRKMPGFVYDYYGPIFKYHTDSPPNRVTHGVNDNAKPYPYGSYERREAPNFNQ